MLLMILMFAARERRDQAQGSKGGTCWTTSSAWADAPVRGYECWSTRIRARARFGASHAAMARWW
jgi:hypothetical protein